MRENGKGPPKEVSTACRAVIVCGLVICLVTCGAGFSGLIMAYTGNGRTSRVVTQSGTLRSVAHRDAAQLQQIVDAVEAYVPQGDPLFINGYVPRGHLFCAVKRLCRNLNRKLVARPGGSA